MAQTLAEQILSHASGQTVQAGEVVTCRVDLAMIHDSIAPSVIRILQQDLGVERVWNREQVAVTIDHVAPAASIQTASAQHGVRRWAIDQDIPNYFETGRGICHQVLIEERLALPGMLVLGSDSHSTAYGAVGAFGSGMGATDMADRKSVV